MNGMTLPTKLPPLSPREREVLVLLNERLLYKEVADRMGITRKTVDSHCFNIARKLGIHGPLSLHDFAQSFRCAALLSEPSRK